MKTVNICGIPHEIRYKHTMAEWSDITGINVSTIKSRHRNGWSDIDILTRPIRGN